MHVIDLAKEIDSLAALAVPEQSCVLARDLSGNVGQWRTAAELLWRRCEFAVAWGGRALRASRRGAVAAGIYRPGGNDVLEPPLQGWRAAAWTDDQRARLIAAGWDGRDVAVVRPPGVDTSAQARGARLVSRRALGIGDEEFIWLLSGDACRTAGLRESIWAGTLMHVMERNRRRHRILVWGDSLVHQRARRFVDQLGLPMLYAVAEGCGYDALVHIADAALITPSGTNGGWSAAVIALAGLPAVVNRDPEVQEVLGGATNVRTAPSDKPKLVVREMLRLSESMPPRLSGDRRFTPEAVQQQWGALVAQV